MSIIKFLFWTMPFGGIVALLNPSVMSSIAHGSNECNSGCLAALGKILLTALFWCAVYMLFFAK